MTNPVVDRIADTAPAPLRDARSSRQVMLRMRRDQHEKLMQAAHGACKSMNQYLLDTVFPPLTKKNSEFSEWFGELDAHARSKVQVLASDRCYLKSDEWREAYDRGATPQQAWEQSRRGE